MSWEELWKRLNVCETQRDPLYRSAMLQGETGLLAKVLARRYIKDTSRINVKPLIAAVYLMVKIFARSEDMSFEELEKTALLQFEALLKEADL